MFLVLSFLLVAYIKNKLWACFRPYQNLGISMGFSASASTSQTFFFCPIKFYFKKWNFYVQYISIFFIWLVIPTISSALAWIYIHINTDRDVNIGCERCFCTAFNNKFALLLISNFINPYHPKVREMCKTRATVLLYFPLKLFSKSYKVHEIWWLFLNLSGIYILNCFFKIRTGFCSVTAFSQPVLLLTILVVFQVEKI